MYCFGAVLLLYALKRGELSVLYPIIATSYIWVLLLSHYYFGDAINLLKIVGISTIVLGVSFIGYGSKKNSPIALTEVP